jgi:hypothetical protein
MRLLRQGSLAARTTRCGETHMLAEPHRQSFESTRCPQRAVTNGEGTAHPSCTRLAYASKGSCLTSTTLAAMPAATAAVATVAPVATSVCSSLVLALTVPAPGSPGAFAAAPRLASASRKAISMMGAMGTACSVSSESGRGTTCRCLWGWLAPETGPWL